MGCCQTPSTSSSFNVCADTLRATKQYFDLGELPVSIKADVKGECLEVRVVGLALVGVMDSLERGFLKRRFWISDATASLRKGLFVGTFELKSFKGPEPVDGIDANKVLSKPCGAKFVVLEPEKQYSRSSVISNFANAVADGDMQKQPELSAVEVETPDVKGTVKLGLEDECDARSSTAQQIARVDAAAAKEGAVLRLTILHRWAPGLRAALLQVMRSIGLHVTLARLTCTKSGRKRMIKDTLWLAPSVTTETRMSCRAKPGGRVSHLEHLFAELPEDESSPAGTRASLVLASEIEAAGTGQVELNIASELAGEEYQPDSQLPWALRKPAKNAPYSLNAIPNDGLQFDGFLKFSGAGMNMSADNRHVLELSTYYISTKNAATTVPFMTQMLQQGDTYAEFVTQYDPAIHRLTIFKVFLNGVLPSGKKAGVKATAEQLRCIPIMGALAQWDGDAALRDLQELHLCDVVNWNTYVLLSNVGKGSGTNVEEWLLQSELSSSGLTLQELQTSTVERIFVKTALGKLVCGLLKDWKDAGVAEHSIQSVNVILDTAKYELVEGEHRAAMDVLVSLSVAKTSL